MGYSVFHCKGAAPDEKMILPEGEDVEKAFEDRIKQDAGVTAHQGVCKEIAKGFKTWEEAENSEAYWDPEEGTMDKHEVESLAKDALEHNPLSAHCQDVLAKLEAGEIPCYDFRISRSAVLCKAWDILEKEKRTKLPVSEAWGYLRTKCRKS